MMATIADINPSVAAGALAGLIALLGFWVNGYRADRRRRRQFYAEALASALDYREFSYAVRRRDHEAPGPERVRLSEAMRQVQQDITRHQALMRVDGARGVEKAYATLVSKTREIAGTYVREAWDEPAITTDPEVNAPVRLDFSAIDPCRDAFLDAVRADLAWWRLWR
jgi:hypothetical protein